MWASVIKAIPGSAPSSNKKEGKQCLVVLRVTTRMTLATLTAANSIGTQRETAMSAQSAKKRLSTSLPSFEELMKTHPPGTAISHSSPKSMSWGKMNFWKTQDWKWISEEIRRTPESELLPRHPRNILRPLFQTPLNKVRVVIIGKEPYALRPDATPDGLAYSAAKMWGTDYHDSPDISSMLIMLYDELMSDVQIARPKHGSLIKWARQGVLLWNWYPTVTVGTLGAHEKLGWDRLSREIMETLWLHDPRIVFVPWGAPPKEFQGCLPSEALMIRTPGPRPNIGVSGFAGSRPFSQINYLLTQTARNGKAIDWGINF